MNKRLKEEVARRYIGALEETFPWLRAETIFETDSGHDVLVRLRIPPDRHDHLMAIQESASDLEERIWDETGISVTATVSEQTAASAHGKAR